MAIQTTSVSYYGLGSVDQAARDFDEMLEHGCNQVILAVTEFDFDFWRPNLPLIVDKAREMGLRTLIDPWGIGKFFGGEQVSLFLQNNVQNRQVSAMTGESLPAACFNTRSFRDYFKRFCVTLRKETNADGFFWDEPHYALPKAYASITGGAGEDWACRCPVCRQRFQEIYGYEMPRLLTDDVKRFRWNEALTVLEDTSRELKEIDPSTEITCCVHATLNSYYVMEQRGYDDWDRVASSPYFDVFSTTILSWDLPESFFGEITRRTVETAKRHGKESERWLMGYYKQPKDFDQIDRMVDLYERLGADRLATWTYRGGHGTVLAAPDALKLWGRIGENYRRVLREPVLR